MAAAKATALISIGGRMNGMAGNVGCRLIGVAGSGVSSKCSAVVWYYQCKTILMTFGPYQH